MHVLISNDDGIFAPGIIALAKAAAERGHRVSIFAPDSQRSAAGHAITLTRPLRATPVELEGFSAFAVDGTPADCVRLGVYLLGEDKPDFVLAGVNNGPNRGAAILYSGTVSAAMEGSLCGVPGVAVSLCHYTSEEFAAAAALGVKTAEWAVKRPLPRGEIYNLNVPFGNGDWPLRAASVSYEFINDALYRQLEDGSYMIEDCENALPETDPCSDFLLTKGGYATLSVLSWNLQSATQLDDISDLQGE